MPYLNWRDAPIRQEISAEGRRTMPGRPVPQILRLELPATRAPELASQLANAIDEGCLTEAGELRVDLPGEWLMFFKLRDAESRLLLAHPERDQWVVTAALERPHAEKLVAGLRTLGSAPAEISLSALGAVGRISNVELRIAVGSG